MDFQRGLQLNLIRATAFQSSTATGCAPALGELALCERDLILDVPVEWR